MALTPEMRAFIDAPDTVDFITRSSDARSSSPSG